MYDWSKHFINNKIIEIWNTYPDYGWAGLTHVKRLGEMFSQYDYDYYNYIIYDTIIDDDVLKILKVGHPKIVFPSKRNEHVWKVGLHLMSFNKKNLKEVISNINLSDYLSYTDFDAFAYLHNHLVKPLNIQIGNKEVEDSIFYYEEVDNKNHSHDKSIKYFISSPDEVVDTLKLYFYNIPKSSSILTTTDLGIATDGNILASYRGGTNLQFGDNGGAYIDGGKVLAQTIGANQLVANSAIQNLAFINK